MLVCEQPGWSMDRLGRSLGRHSDGWEVEIANGRQGALDALADQPADVLICAEELTATDATALLSEVRDRYPTTIRMILVAAGDSPRSGGASILAHRLLSRTSAVEQMGQSIERSCQLRSVVGEAAAYRSTLATTTLPSSPGVYMELNRILCEPGWSPNQIAAVIERDVAVTAKVLALANSAVFSLTREITSVRDAFVYLGVDTVRSLALTAESFDKFAPSAAAGFSIDAFQDHSTLVAQITAAILPGGRAQQQAVTAGLLHDIGKLLLISDSPDRWRDLSEQARSRHVALHEVEAQTAGVTHAALGAYLLSVWDLPDAIIDAVAHHHDPGSVPGLAFDAVAAVHIADALAHELQSAGDDQPPAVRLDDALLDELGLRPRLELWRHQAAQPITGRRHPGSAGSSGRHAIPSARLPNHRSSSDGGLPIGHRLSADTERQERVPTYPVRFERDFVQRRSRLTTFFRGLLAVPHSVFATRRQRRSR